MTGKGSESSRSASLDRETEIDDLPETEMIGSSTRMIEIYKTLSQVAPTDASVLLTGETGTGKELVARMIHTNSKRLTGPFVPVDCGSIAPSLLWDQFRGFQPNLRFQINAPLPGLDDRVQAVLGQFNPDEFITERAQSSGSLRRQFGAVGDDQTILGLVTERAGMKKMALRLEPECGCARHLTHT